MVSIVPVQTTELTRMGYPAVDKFVPPIARLGAQIGKEKLEAEGSGFVARWIPTAAQAAGGMEHLIQKALTTGFTNLLRSIEGHEDELLKTIAENALQKLDTHMAAYEGARGKIDPRKARVTQENEDGDVELNIAERQALGVELLRAMANLGYSNLSVTGTDAVKQARLEALSESIIQIMFPGGQLPLDDLPMGLHYFGRAAINRNILEQLKTQILPAVLEECLLSSLRNPHTTYKLINKLLAEGDSAPIDAVVRPLPQNIHQGSANSIVNRFANIVFPGLLSGLDKVLSVITFGRFNLSKTLSAKIDSVVNTAIAQLDAKELLNTALTAGRGALFNDNGTSRAHVVTPAEIEASRQAAVKKIRDLLTANTVGLLTGWAVRFNEYARNYTSWGATAIKIVNFLRSALGTLLIAVGNLMGKIPFLWWVSADKVHEYLQTKAELIVDELSSPAMEVFYLNLLEDMIAQISRQAGQVPRELPQAAPPAPEPVVVEEVD